MAENAQLSVTAEAYRNVAEGFVNAGHALRHEGLKKGAEAGLHHLGNHYLGRAALELLAGSRGSDPRLATSLAGIDLTDCVGLAPGWDKQGKAILGLQAIGAGFITLGGFTLYLQPGNHLPRLFTFDRKFGDHGKLISINRFGFSSPGVGVGIRNIREQRERGEVTIPIFGQVTLNKEAYLPEHKHEIPDRVRQTTRALLPVVDGINLGLSSPNTSGMREAQDAFEFMYEVYMAAQDEIHKYNGGREVPLFGKGDGDGGTARWDIYCELSRQTGCHWELINTTGLERIKAKYGAKDVAGGLAGADPDYRKLGVDAVSYVYNQVGDKIDIIGAAGVGGPEYEKGDDQAMALLRGGASAVEFNTYMRTGGLKSFTHTKRGIIDSLDRENKGSVREIIGIDTKRGAKYPLTA
jgi:dihydroorotate dehydrogenase